MNNANVCRESGLKLNGARKLPQTNPSPVTSKYVWCRKSVFSPHLLSDTFNVEGGVRIRDGWYIAAWLPFKALRLSHSALCCIIYCKSNDCSRHSHKMHVGKGQLRFPLLSPPSTGRFERPLACYVMLTFMWVVPSSFSSCTPAERSL